MLHLLIDTSTWLDVCKRRDGQRWIVTLRVLSHQKLVNLLVPQVVCEEFRRNRAKVEKEMTQSITERFKHIKRDIDTYGGATQEQALELIEDLERHVPLIGAMTTRNFDDTQALLERGQACKPTAQEHAKVIERALSKRAPFHRSNNSVADALLIEMYASAMEGKDLESDPHAFVTSNKNDFSHPGGDDRAPHPDFEEIFSREGSSYGFRVEGLNKILIDHFVDEVEELSEDYDFVEEPRRLAEISEAERELRDRLWYHSSLQHQYWLYDNGTREEVERLIAIARPGRERIEAEFPESGQLGPFTEYQLGMLDGKLSALRWVLGSEWDFLDL
jgi:hypothetical protein